MEVLNQAPNSASFVSLADHQSTTPVSFYNGPPVLHYYSDRCKVVVLEDELKGAPAVANLATKSADHQTSNGNGSAHVNGDDSTRTEIDNVDIWVTSDKFLLYSTSRQTGFSIPYPSIALHAIQSLPEPSAVDTSSQGLYMQVMTSPPSQSSDEEPDSISITVIPTASATPTSAAPTDPSVADPNAEVRTEDIPETSPVQALFTALSNCSNLHPDPVDSEDQDAVMRFEGDDEGVDGVAGSRLFQAGLLQPGAAGDGLPPPMPGSGGWITAENMHEYFDDQGNWIGPENGDEEMGEDDDDEDNDGDAHAANNGNELDSTPLGPGAGTVRSRDDADGAEITAVDNGLRNEDETKWRRTG